MMRIRIILILMSLSLSAETYSQSIKETINQHIIDGTYESIEGIWLGKYKISFFVNQQLQGEMPSNVVISLYKDGRIIKGSKTDVPQDNGIQLAEGATIGSFEWILPTSPCKVNGAGKQSDEFSLILIHECKSVDQYGIPGNIFQEYELKKLYPRNSDFAKVKDDEIERRKTELENAPRSGTGFAISSDGYIVTCYHVVRKAKSIKVRGLNGNFTQSLRAEVIQEDESNDLAIIKIQDNESKSVGTIPFKIKQSASDVGEDIFVLGYPLTATMGDEVKLTTGIISSKTGFQGSVSQYQVSAPIQAGNSGGPLFDKTGNIIGVINSKHLDTENVGYAIKATYLQNIIDILPQKISTPNVSGIANKSLSEKVKVLRNFVFLIEVNNE